MEIAVVMVNIYIYKQWDIRLFDIMPTQAKTQRSDELRKSQKVTDNTKKWCSIILISYHIILYHIISYHIWLVVSTPLINISQLGLLFPIYGKS